MTEGTCIGILHRCQRHDSLHYSSQQQTLVRWKGRFCKQKETKHCFIYIIKQTIIDLEALKGFSPLHCGPEALCRPLCLHNAFVNIGAFAWILCSRGLALNGTMTTAVTAKRGDVRPHIACSLSSLDCLPQNNLSTSCCSLMETCNLSVSCCVVCTSSSIAQIYLRFRGT